ncbi:N-acetylmannosamine-6-phosphate 2-epimerase [Aliiroseovarius sp. Z3]|uniref:N-acetylmannosamine-6-phosphate 2-epimerase n=1 Tax=Aliiroseovarius sp. Z3 TaxID=2811402 RepID=UPI0023B2AB7A|nr:N-acetylmannosamine-6-phosphate 2-epimerase [Aliiroseovarius sp. Z3]MDE9451910.1 N-acetylmannosamine-6-phosphate 2-epimerase [Aliiroseovarius sp. Z3]
MLDLLRNGLVVSCQPVDGGPMDDPEIISAMARAAIAGGADGVRIQGVANLRHARKSITAPIIGIVKRDLPDSPVRITPFLDDVAALAQAGADIIAYDATSRARPVSCAAIVEEIAKHGCLAMADCSNMDDAKGAVRDGAQIVGSTLSGYTDETADSGPEPDLEFVEELARLDAFVMAEGRYANPDLAKTAIKAGADCVTVGTPLTRLEVNTALFRAAISQVT